MAKKREVWECETCGKQYSGEHLAALCEEQDKILAVKGEHPRMIRVWRFEDAPLKYQEMSRNGGDEDWIAFVPKAFLATESEPWWLHEGGPFGCCSVNQHDVEGGRIFIGCHA